jgi:ATP-dependent RNA helicase RhlE
MPTFSRRGSSGGRGRFSNNRSRGGDRFSTYIDHSMYIKKAEPQVQQEYVNKHQFADFDVHPALKKILADRGFEKPSPIQDQTIPLIIEGKDIIGLANTGTGKTLAFLLPLVDKVLRDPTNRVLVVAPTRELALQIEEELLKITLRDMRIFSTCCVGGAPIGNQLRRLSFPNHFVIGTPGRLMDLAERGALNLSEFNHIILDEADHMVDMGFIDDIRWIIARLKPERQSLFFSATLDRKLEPLAQSFLNNPITVSVVNSTTSNNVNQDVVHIGRDENKMEVLVKILEQENVNKVLVFGNTKMMADRIAEGLFRAGFRAEALHGDKRLSQRKKILFDFKRGDLDVLVATDVAARGIDIPQVTHVINYDEPQNFEYYVHRIGRTGRGGSMGHALTFVQK